MTIGRRSSRSNGSASAVLKSKSSSDSLNGNDSGENVGPLTTTNHELAIRVVIGILALSCLAPLVMYVMNEVESFHTEEWLLFVVGLAICISIIPLTYILVIRPLSDAHVSKWVYLFSVFSFTSSVDLWLAFSIDDFTPIGLFYLRNGEVYLRSSHGGFINYWDGSIHWLFYLLIIYHSVAYGASPTSRKISANSSFSRFASLYWVGSISNSMIVLLMGAASGKYGPEVKPSCLLNTPYLIFPLVYGYQILSNRATFTRSYILSYRKSSSSETSVQYRELSDYFFIGFFIFSSFFAVFRALCAVNSPIPWVQNYKKNVEPYMNDPSSFPTIQLWIYFFYFIPFYYMAIHALLSTWKNNTSSKNSSSNVVISTDFDWVPDWSAIHCGASCQALFSYFCSSIHNAWMFPEPTWRMIPDDALTWNLLINFLLFVVPILFQFRTCAGDGPIQFYQQRSKDEKKN